MKCQQKQNTHFRVGGEFPRVYSNFVWDGCEHGMIHVVLRSLRSRNNSFIAYIGKNWNLRVEKNPKLFAVNTVWIWTQSSLFFLDFWRKRAEIHYLVMRSNNENLYGFLFHFETHSKVWKKFGPERSERTLFHTFERKTERPKRLKYYSVGSGL